MFYVLVPTKPLNLSKLTASDAVEFMIYGGKYGNKKITATISESVTSEKQDKLDKTEPEKRFYANFTLPEVFFVEGDTYLRKENWNLSLPFNHNFLEKDDLTAYHAVMENGTTISNPIAGNFPPTPQTLALLNHVANVQVQFLNGKYCLKTNGKPIAEFTLNGQKLDNIKLLISSEEIATLVENSNTQVAIAIGATTVAYNTLKLQKESALERNSKKSTPSAIIPNYSNVM